MTTIRPIRDIDAESWAGIFEQYRANDGLPPNPLVVESVRQWILDPSFNLEAVAAVDGGSVVGMAIYRRFPRPASATVGIYLDDLFVTATCRGRGYARQLIAAVIAAAESEQATLVRWISSADNAAAQRLYDRVATRTDWVTYEVPLLPRSASNS